MKYKFYEPSPKSNERLFFEKDYRVNKKLRRFHVQLTWKNSKVWKNALRFRDILKENPEIVKKYAAVKRKAARLAKGNGAIYRAQKAEFIQNLIQKEK